MIVPQPGTSSTCLNEYANDGTFSIVTVSAFPSRTCTVAAMSPAGAARLRHERCAEIVGVLDEPLAPFGHRGPRHEGNASRDDPEGQTSAVSVDGGHYV